MAISFFEKSKERSEVEPQTEDYEVEQSPAGIKKTKKLKKIKVLQNPEEVQKLEEKETIEKQEENIAEEPILTGTPVEEKENWFQSAGQLAIDVYETDGEIIVQAPIAGVKAEDLDITIENDMLIIKGYREKPLEPAGDKNYFYEECYWGPFIRKVILSEEVDASRVEANLKEGVLTLRAPKIERSGKRKIMVKE